MTRERKESAFLQSFFHVHNFTLALTKRAIAMTVPRTFSPMLQMFWTWRQLRELDNALPFVSHSYLQGSFPHRIRNGNNANATQALSGGVQ